MKRMIDGEIIEMGIEEIETFEASHRAPPPTTEKIREVQIEAAKIVRIQKQEAGALVDGMVFHAMPEDLFLLDSACTKLQTGALQGPVNWKCKNGWTTLTAENAAGIQAAVLGFVQACYDEEKAAVDAIGKEV